MGASPQHEVFTSPIPRHTVLLAPGPARHLFHPAPWGLALVEVVIGYKWLLSGLNKVLSAGYLPGLADALQASMQENPNRWWVTFIHQQVLPHVQVWAQLVALGCFIGAVLWTFRRFPATRWTRWLNAGVLLALGGGVLMTTNYYLMAGHGLPGLNPGDPFDEGLSLDGVLTAIGLGLLLIHLLAWRFRERPVEPAFRQYALKERRVEGPSL